jgi:hypothetical protein
LRSPPTREERALGDPVGHDVERGGAGPSRAADPVQHQDVAVLRDRRVGENLLELILGQGERAPDEDRGKSDGEQPVEHRLAAGQQRMHPPDDENSGGDHRRGVQVGGDRRRRCHGTGQPEVQRHLGALGQRADRQEHSGNRHGRAAAGVREQRWNRRRAPLGVEEDGGDQDGDRADTGHDERHERRHAGFAPVTVEADQEVRADCGDVEQDEEQHEILRKRQPHHRGHEQRHPGPETPLRARRLALVLEVQRQVTRPVPEDDDADAAGEQAVERAQAVEREAQAQAERRCPRDIDCRAAARPACQRRDEGRAGGGHSGPRRGVMPRGGHVSSPCRSRR